MQAYMKSEMPFLGLQAPALRRVCREVIAAHQLSTREDVDTAVRRLWREAEFREERYAALTLAHRYRRLASAETLTLYEELVVTGAWWDLVDSVAHLAGDLVRRYPSETKPAMRAWSTDENIWKRRVSIICQLGFKQDTDVPLLYACIKPSLGSHEFFLRKAIGWALRDYAWHDPREVERYVRENADRLSPLSTREATKHLVRMLGQSTTQWLPSPSGSSQRPVTPSSRFANAVASSSEAKPSSRTWRAPSDPVQTPLTHHGASAARPS